MKEMKKMSDKDLVSLVGEKREMVRGHRFGAGTRDVKSVRTAKKEIARALTELSMRGKNNVTKSDKEQANSADAE